MSDAPTPKSVPPLDDERLHTLIEVWQNARDSGRCLTVEQLCPDDLRLARQLQVYIEDQSISVDQAIDLQSNPRDLTSIGPYEVVRFIGCGGSSDVFLCNQERPKREVALKLLNASHCEKRLLRRFQVEIELLATLEHAGIARIFDAGEADIGHGPQPYYTMEFVDGLRLDHYLEVVPKTEFTVEDRLRLFVRIARAVQYAHDNGIVHRDLKPSNILVSKRGAIKVIDFGLARTTNADRTVASMTQAGHFVGTPLYMSPEQFNQEKRLVDTRSDVYSLGVVLYQMLAGKFPYDLANKSIIEIANTVIQERPRPLAGCVAGAGSGLELIVMKMLEKEPADRYQTLSGVMSDLSNHLDGMPISVKRPSVLEPVTRWCRRNPVLAATASAAAFTLFASLSVTLLATSIANSRTAELRETLDDLAERRDEAFRQRELAESRADELGTANNALSEVTERLRRSTSNATLRQASQIAETNPQQAHSMLMDTKLIPVSHRAFAWGVVRHQTDWTEREGRWGRGPVIALAFSGNGESYAAAAIGGIEVRRTHDLSLICSTLDRIEHPTMLAFDFDGKRLVYRKPDHTVVLLEVPSGNKTALELGHVTRPTSVAWSKSGRLAVGDSQGEVRVWRAMKDQPEIEFRVGEKAVVGMRFSSDESILGTATSDGVIQTNDLRDGQGIESYRTEVKGLHNVIFDSSLRYVAGGRRFHYVAQWDRETQQRLFYRNGPGPFIAVSPIAGAEGGFVLATRSRMQFSLPNREPAFVQLSNDSIRAVCLTPDGSHVLSGDGAGNQVLFRSQPHHTPKLLPVTAERVRCVRFIQSGNELVVGGVDHPIQVRSLRTNQLISTLPFPVSPMVDVEPSMDGSLLFYCMLDGTLASWDLKREQPGPMHLKRDQRTVDIAIQDSTRLIALMRRGNIVQYSIETNLPLQELDAHASRGTALLLSHKNGTIYSADEKGVIKSWDLETFQSKEMADTGGPRVHSMAIDKDGKFLATAASDSRIRIYDAEDLSQLVELTAHTGPVRSVDFSPDGKTLASGGMDDRVVLTDTASWQVQFEKLLPRDGIRCVRFSPKGECLAVVGNCDNVAVFETSANSTPGAAVSESVPYP